MKKINQLIKNWPRGSIMTLGYLKTMNINRELVKRYKNSGWIEVVGRGAYKLSGDDVTWQGALYTLQRQMQMRIRVGGRTALELKGFGHYINPETRIIFLFGMPGDLLPKWFKDYFKSENFIYKMTNLFSSDYILPLSGYKYKEFNINISAPELAALEMLYHVPDNQGFVEASYIIESLTTIRPVVIQELLENCNSVKVKRLFLYMAEKQNHSWLNELNFDKINLGSGKRLIVENGVLDKKYQITVPRD
jgi:hypothetical protein